MKTKFDVLYEQTMNEMSITSIGQGVLDIIGLVPGVGEPADIINAIIYFNKFKREKKMLDLAYGVISLISAFPEPVGDLLKLVKYIPTNKIDMIIKILIQNKSKIKKGVDWLNTNKNKIKQSAVKIKSSNRAHQNESIEFVFEEGIVGNIKSAFDGVLNSLKKYTVDKIINGVFDYLNEFKSQIDEFLKLLDDPENLSNMLIKKI